MTRPRPAPPAGSDGTTQLLPTVGGRPRIGRFMPRANSVPRAGPGRIDRPRYAASTASGSAPSVSMPATILALIFTALTALVAPVCKMTAMISSRIAR
jgi:hypothetical protein